MDQPVTTTRPRFELVAQHGRARAGLLHTWRGTVETPVFMPVGTRGAIKGLTAAQVAATGAKIILANNYHLVVHPGPDEVEALGGLNAFTGWPGPMLTDSGGFQVFSLEDSRTIDDDGVTFRSPRTGDAIRFTPAGTVNWQRQMGSTFIMQLDECAPWPCDREVAERAMERSLKWARIGAGVALADWQIMLPIVQGSTFPDLRERSVDGLRELDAAAYAVGGVSVGEDKAQQLEMTGLCTARLPEDRPRYLMGVGKPGDIVAGVSLGIDMFDCVLPTRNARHALAFTSQGIVRLRNSRHRDDRGPLDPQCDCTTCAGDAATGAGALPRGYLRHLFMVEDPTGHALVSIHNLRYYQRLMRDIRTAIIAGRDLQTVLPAATTA
ncbi:MAG: tRNA guanosine(34) transglycosylase Tgt [Planctomycetota bacterium]